jgi:DnaK suppressor protein
MRRRRIFSVLMNGAPLQASGGRWLQGRDPLRRDVEEVEYEWGVRESSIREVLDAERRVTLARIAAMTTDLEGIVTASEGANTDDEHDPEGPTIAYERAQLASLLAEARAYLGDLDMALSRLADGTYSVCEKCGARIASERLAARPGTRACIGCAGSGPMSSPSG